MPRDPNRGYLLAVLPLLVGLEATPTSEPRYPLCKPGHEFWSADRGVCWPCTRCAPEFTLSPCAIHKDAICGPLSALELDWSFLSTGKRQETGQRRLDAVTSKMLWRFPEIRDDPQDLADLRRRFDELEPNVDPNDEGEGELRERRKIFAESKVIWDWQTCALVLAVCACILFFLAAGCSALVYARQWRRIKKNFEPAGLEEISARLNLMVKAELAELVSGAPITPGDPESRCQYLEKLLDRKRETPVLIGWPDLAGNLYIEDGEPPKSKRLQIARIHRNIETILSQKREIP